jgi:hypothetical protein
VVRGARTLCSLLHSAVEVGDSPPLASRLSPLASHLSPLLSLLASRACFPGIDSVGHLPHLVQASAVRLPWFLPRCAHSTGRSSAWLRPFG